MDNMLRLSPSGIPPGRGAPREPPLPPAARTRGDDRADLPAQGPRGIRERADHPHPLTPLGRPRDEIEDRFDFRPHRALGELALIYPDRINPHL